MQVHKGYNPFLKVGTGQGKSLIIALLAAHYAKEGHRVQVFTCYQHLAARDFKRFQKLYEDLSIEAVLVESKNTKYPTTAQVTAQWSCVQGCCGC